MIVQMVLLSNCVEKQGYYNDGEESIIALICDITWTGGKKEYLQPIITQYFIDNKSEIWLLFLIAHSKR